MSYIQTWPEWDGLAIPVLRPNEAARMREGKMTQPAKVHPTLLATAEAAYASECRLHAQVKSLHERGLVSDGILRQAIARCDALAAHVDAIRSGRKVQHV